MKNRQMSVWKLDVLFWFLGYTLAKFLPNKRGRCNWYIKQIIWISFSELELQDPKKLHTAESYGFSRLEKIINNFRYRLPHWCCVYFTTAVWNQIFMAKSASPTADKLKKPLKKTIEKRILVSISNRVNLKFAKRREISPNHLENALWLVH
jgi:hypothetical protein